MALDDKIAIEDILAPSTDFNYLREEGIKLIEKYGSYFWNDYNYHDPGITILDVLVYAITELGYRSTFDIETLLTDENGNIDNITFFKPNDILTNAPWTINDWRKAIIDIDGIANAWYVPQKSKKDQEGYYLPNQQEIALYFDKLQDKLSYEATDQYGNGLASLSIKGLNKICIELEEDPLLGDLNDLSIMMHVWYKERYLQVKVTPNIAHWNEEKTKLFALLNKPNKIVIESAQIINQAVVIKVNRYTQASQGLIIAIHPIDLQELNDCLNYFSTEKNICHAINLFAQKYNYIQNTINTVNNTLNNYRNLAEDCINIEIIQKIEIGICVDIEIKPMADASQLMATIWLTLQELINPSIKFYTLQELMQEGLTSKEIFNGPQLKNGFIKTTELKNSDLPNAIYASDIIAQIMNIDGVLAVNNLIMTAYNNKGIPIESASNQNWVLPLSGVAKAVFNKDISKLLLFANNIPYLLSEVQMHIAQQQYENFSFQKNTKRKFENYNSYPIINGDTLALNKFYSIQTDLPSNYRIGNNEPGVNEPESVKAASKQLKAYLFFFETLIANFFSQLHHAKDLLNVGKLKQSYVGNPIDKYALGFDKNYYEDILFDKLESIYANESILENSATRIDRKNKALDHLLARFAESFNEYALTMYQISLGKNGATINQEHIIEQKERFLKDYDKISYARGNGINYTGYKQNTDYKNENLRGGYEKRIARILGIKNITLNNIISEPSMQEQWTLVCNDGAESYTFFIINPEESLPEKWLWCMEHMYDDDNYKINKIGDKYIIYLYNTIKIARLNKSFQNYNEANIFLINMIQNINAYFENFYCLEHILLRPYFKGAPIPFKLLSTCLNDNCGTLESSDPYSAKVTLIFPGYLQRFKNLTFRKFAEQTIRKESPPHILLKICWVGYQDMIQFQKAYREWIPIRNEYTIKKNTQKLSKVQHIKLVEKQNSLVIALESMNNIYPKGTLYDCKVSNLDNPIILGNTALGSTKNN